MEEDQGAAAASGVTSSKKKQEEKHRKKDPRSWDNISKSLTTLDEADKVPFIAGKYQELYNNVRKLSQENQQLVRQNVAIQKDRDHNQSELTKNIVARARLENLCRELQKQNKQIKEENLTKIKEEEERRKEVSLKFTEKLSDINTMMDENKEKSDKLREENLKMTAKLSDLYTQFQQREDDISKMSHQLELEREFSQATLAKMELEIKAEKEMHAKEQELMKNNLEKSEANCCVLLDTVKGLQDHINIYKNQYEDFESTMSKSSKVFDNFKFEIANMTKQVATLEQEAQSWKTKFHDSMRALVEMSELKKSQEAHVQSVEKKNDQLHKLCRQLQVDRSNYLKLLKVHGIEPASIYSPRVAKAEEEGAKKSSVKMTKKEKELETLKENLKAVQSQLSKISVTDSDTSQTSKTEEEDEPSEELSEEGAQGVDLSSVEEEKVSHPPSPEVCSQKVVLIDHDKGVMEEVELLNPAQSEDSIQTKKPQP